MKLSRKNRKIKEHLSYLAAEDTFNMALQKSA